MANFQPLKTRFLCVLDRMIQDHQISGTFLDYGCGRGDVAEYLAGNNQFVSGSAYDPSWAGETPPNPASRCPVFYTNDKEKLDSVHDLAVLFDVIEHVSEPERLLCDISIRTRPQAWLAITVPYNRREWGVDDEFYGHLRRLSRQGVVDMLEQSGWQVVRMLDPTFPSFWLIRRIYLLWERVRGRHGAKDSFAGEDEAARSLQSSRVSAWSESSRMVRNLSNSTLLWRICRKLDVSFESIYLGFELFVLCRKMPTPRRCEVCRRADVRYSWSCAEGSVWMCPHCGSQLMDAWRRASTPVPRLPACTRFVKDWWEHRQLRSMGMLLPQAGRLLNVSSRSTCVQDEGAMRSITTVESLEQSSGTMGSFDGVIALHALERTEKLESALDEIDRRLRPGGFLEIEFFSARSLFLKITGKRWAGYDWLEHCSIANPVGLADFMGLHNYRLVREVQLSWAYAILVAVQSSINVFMPWQRNALYDWLKGRRQKRAERGWGVVSVPLGCVLLPLCLLVEGISVFLGRGSVARQLYRKMGDGRGQ